MLEALEPLAHLVQLEYQVHLVLLAHGVFQEQLAFLVLREVSALKELSVNQAHPVTLAFLVVKGSVGLWDRQDLRVLRDNKDLPEQQDSRDRRELLVTLAFWVYKEALAILVQLESREILDRRDLQDHKDSVVPLVPLVQLEIKDLVDPLVSRVLRDQLGKLVPSVSLDSPVTLELQEIWVPLGQKDLSEQLGPQDSLDWLDRRDKLA
jgi:hypothetical protein